MAPERGRGTIRPGILPMPYWMQEPSSIRAVALAARAAVSGPGTGVVRKLRQIGRGLGDIVERFQAQRGSRCERHGRIDEGERAAGALQRGLGEVGIDAERAGSVRPHGGDLEDDKII